VIGGFIGTIAGIVVGPVTMIAWMQIEHDLYGAMFLGLELIGAPILGGLFGALEGAILGLVWPAVSSRSHQLTIGELMVGVVISGPLLSLVVILPPIWVGLLAGAVALVTIPCLILLGHDRPPDQEQRHGTEAIPYPGLDALATGFTSFEH
jgi:hypothetical protein